LNIDPKWLSVEQFKIAVDSLPLVSIDLYVLCEKQILLGKRNNRPAKNWWFTPGGRVKKNELSWEPKETFETGIRRTIQWYLENEDWWRKIQDGSYNQERLGIKNEID